MQSVALQPLTSPEALQPPKITPVPLPYSPPFLRPPRGSQAPWRGLVEELVRKFFIFDSSAASKIFENSFAPTKNRKLENPAAVTARFLRLTLIDCKSALQSFRTALDCLRCSDYAAEL